MKKGGANFPIRVVTELKPELDEDGKAIFDMEAIEAEKKAAPPQQAVPLILSV